MIRFNILGRLTRDPELENRGEMTIVKMAVASNRGDKNKTTDFADVTAFNKLGENISKFFKKGDMIYLEGNVQFDVVEKEGKKNKYTNLIATSFEFCGSKSNSKEDELGNPLLDEDPDKLPF